MDNLEEMDKFLETYNQPFKTNLGKNGKSKQITSNEIEAVIKNSQQTKARDQKASQVNSTKHLKKDQYLFFSDYLKKLKREDHLQTHSMRPALP